jgi:methylated-DNA-[protein]-cysteine S-methyltransferase
MPVAGIETWLGCLTVKETDGAITDLQWNGEPSQAETPLLRETIRQLSAYLDGDLKNFDLPLSPKGGDLHQAVFKAMLEIPYGETRTYGDLARDLATYGQPIGQACGANPHPGHHPMSQDFIGQRAWRLFRFWRHGDKNRAP